MDVIKYTHLSTSEHLFPGSIQGHVLHLVILSPLFPTISNSSSTWSFVVLKLTNTTKLFCRMLLP